MIKFSVKHPVSISMIIGVVLMLGILSFSRIGIDLLPDITYPSIVILTKYPGMSSKEIEAMVSRHIEKALSTIDGIKEIKSVSSQGVSYVSATFDWNKKINSAFEEVKDRIDMVVPYLPEGVSSPVLLKFSTNMVPVIAYKVSGSVSRDRITSYIKKEVIPIIEQVDGVGRVDIQGGIEQKLYVDVKLPSLLRYNVSIKDVYLSLMANNVNMGLGDKDIGAYRYFIDMKGSYQNIFDLNNILVAYNKAGPVFLHDIANVHVAAEKSEDYSSLNGKEAVGINIRKRPGVNTLKLVERIKRVMERIVKTKPDGFDIVVSYDQSELIKKTTENTTNNALLGALLAAIVILFFLHNWRSTLIVSLAMPLSIVMAYIVVYFSGFSLNIMTLLGIGLGVGMLVDSAVVVTENIFRHMEEGEDSTNASINGTREIAAPIASSVITNIVVFLPVLFMKGVIGRMTFPMAVAMSAVLVSSFFVALTIIPSASAQFLKGVKKNYFLKQFGELWFLPLKQWYRHSLKWALNNRKIILLITFLLFIFSILGLFIIRREFIPDMDSGFVIVTIKYPEDLPFEDARSFSKFVEKIALQEKGQKTVSIHYGKTSKDILSSMFITGGHIRNEASLNVQLLQMSKRRFTSREFVDRLIKKIPSVKGVSIYNYSFSKSSVLGSGVHPLEIEIFGDDINTLIDIAKRIKDTIRTIEGIGTVEVSSGAQKPEIQLKIDRVKAAFYGLTPYEIEEQVAIAVKGRECGFFYKGEKDYPIVLELRKDYRKTLNDLLSITIRNRNNEMINLNDVAYIAYDSSVIEIERKNQTRVVSVYSSNVKDLGKVWEKVINRTAGLSLPAGYRLSYGGEWKEMQNMTKELGFALIAAIILVYMVMAAIFESFKDPFIIFITMPVAFIGVIFLLLIANITLSIMSLVGSLILVGVVVNSGIIMIDYIKLLRRKGVDAYEALIEGAATRLRPILITTTTTIVGMVPMAFIISEGYELRQPMSIALIGGLLSSTIISLYLIPIVYAIVKNIKIRKERK